MQSITAMLPESCCLVREGREIQLGALDIVPGDILLLKAGNRIPADVRYIQVSHDMTIDRAVLTGLWPRFVSRCLHIPNHLALLQANQSRSKGQQSPPTTTTSRRIV